MNNIFDYAPKELVMDAFFTWIFKELNEQTLSKHKLHFLTSLKLKGFTESSKITEVKKQVENTDLLIKIDDKQILFENKTTSTIHSDQLKVYREKLDECHQYIYMKLGFIDFKEEKQAKKHGYTIVNIDNIIQALEPLKGCCQIVNQYYNFLDTKYREKLQGIHTGIKNNDETIYCHSDAQRIFLSRIHKKLDSEKIANNFIFRYSANRGGSPWTQLSIAHKDNQYGDTKESIFWRIDKKKNNGYYVRLTQYANIDNTHKKEKKERLCDLRNCFKKSMPNGLVSGIVSNKGLKSSEIGIFYFKDNKHDELSKALVNLSIDFIKEYKEL